MHGLRWGIWGLIIATGAGLLSGAGCSWHRTSQGWILKSSWSLEFTRKGSFCDSAAMCGDGCETCNVEKPFCTSAGNTESNVLYESSPTLLQQLGNSPFARLLARRGRLGICASCGRLGRFNEPIAGETASPPIQAKFHPVPTQPVFCPRDETTQKANFQAPLKEIEQDSSPTKAPSLEDIPPPPPVPASPKR